MAEALIGGILEAEIAAPENVKVGEPVKSRCQYLEQTYSLKAYGSNLDVLPGADLVVLAIKPQTLPLVLPELRGNMEPANTVVSIIAGATMSTLVGGLDHSPVIRVMPNTPTMTTT